MGVTIRQVLLKSFPAKNRQDCCLPAKQVKNNCQQNAQDNTGDYWEIKSKITTLHKYISRQPSQAKQPSAQQEQSSDHNHNAAKKQ
jgi:hypothetical protein